MCNLFPVKVKALSSHDVLATLAKHYSYCKKTNFRQHTSAVMYLCEWLLWFGLMMWVSGCDLSSAAPFQWNWMKFSPAGCLTVRTVDEGLLDTVSYQRLCSSGSFVQPSSALLCLDWPNHTQNPTHSVHWLSRLKCCRTSPTSRRELQNLYNTQNVTPLWNQHEKKSQWESENTTQHLSLVSLIECWSHKIRY